MESINKVKQLIIESESEFYIEVHPEEEVQMYINGMKDEIQDCNTLEDVIDFYTSRGYKENEAYKIVVNLLLK